VSCAMGGRSFPLTPPLCVIFFCVYLLLGSHCPLVLNSVYVSLDIPLLN
jgi:hypothetical protein